MKKTLVINLYGGPGSAKSTICAGVFSQLKWKEVECELNLEFAKDLVFEESFENLKNQLYVFGNQHIRMSRLNGKVDIIVTDSPLLNSIIYDAKNDPIFKELILREHNKLNNFNIFLNRKKKYNPNGRLQTEEEAIELDKQIKNMLIENEVDFIELDGIPENIDVIVDKAIKLLESNP